MTLQKARTGYFGPPATLAQVAEHEYGVHVHCLACGKCVYCSQAHMKALAARHPGVPLIEYDKRRKCTRCGEKRAQTHLSSPQLDVRISF